MQAQFLDEQHLLLALGPPDASALRHAESQQHAAFLAVVSLQVRQHLWCLKLHVTVAKLQRPKEWQEGRSSPQWCVAWCRTASSSRCCRTAARSCWTCTCGMPRCSMPRPPPAPGSGAFVPDAGSGLDAPLRRSGCRMLQAQGLFELHRVPASMMLLLCWQVPDTRWRPSKCSGRRGPPDGAPVLDAAAGGGLAEHLHELLAAPAHITASGSPYA